MKIFPPFPVYSYTKTGNFTTHWMTFQLPTPDVYHHETRYAVSGF